MDRKSWCDLCAAYCEGVHLYDFWCTQCGKIETLTACGKTEKVLGYIRAAKCVKCNQHTPRRVAKSLYPEVELNQKEA